MIDSEPEEATQQARQMLPPMRGKVRVEQVTFLYHPESDRNTLENLSFDAQHGGFRGHKPTQTQR